MIHKFTTEDGENDSDVVNIQSSGYGTFTAKPISGFANTCQLEGRNSPEDSWHNVGDPWLGADGTAFKPALFSQMRVTSESNFSGTEVFLIQVPNV